MEPEEQQPKSNQPASTQQDELLFSIKANAQPETSPSSVELSSHSKNKLLLPLILSVVLLFTVLAIAGIFIFKNFNSPQTNVSSTKNQPVSTITPVKEPPSPTPDPTANWKTYTNTEYGYSIKYPSQLTAAMGGKGMGDISKTGIISFVEQRKENSFQFPHFSINVMSDTDTLDEISASHYQYLTQTRDSFSESETKISEKNLGYSIVPNKVIKKRSKTNFKGLPSYQYTILGSTVYNGLEEYLVPVEEYQYIWIENNNKFYLISFTNTDVMKQILSTFKFIKTNEKDKSEKGKITGKLCYPSDFLPQGEIVAKNTITGKSFTQTYTGSLNGGENSYTFSLPDGEYKLRYQAHASSKNPESFISGYYNACTIGGLTADSCDSNNYDSHKIIPVQVIPGKTIENIDLCDFYYGNNEPDF